MADVQVVRGCRGLKQVNIATTSPSPTPLSNSKLALRPIRFVGVVACDETSSDGGP
jgi:hypothetical protein